MVTIMNFPKNSELVFSAIIKDINNIKNECMNEGGLKKENVLVEMSYSTYKFLGQFFEDYLPITTAIPQKDFGYICGCKIEINNNLKFGELQSV